MRLYTLSAILILFSQCLFSQWQETEPMTFNLAYRHHPVNFVHEGYGYLVTGVGRTAGTGDQYLTSDFYKYDPVEDTWETLPTFPGMPRGFAYGDTTGGKAYMGFGIGPNNALLNDLWEYDFETETWTRLSDCPGNGRLHPAFIAENKYIVVGMGNGAGGNYNDFWMYEVETDTWTQMPNIPGPGRHHPFHFGIDGTVYAGMGHGSVEVDWGQGNSVIYRDWFKWELGESTDWTVLDTFPGEPRVAGQQFSWAGRGFVISGQGANHGNFSEGEFWEYLPETDTWNQLPPHPGSGRWAPGSWVLNDRIYIMGGEPTLGGIQQATNTMIYKDLIPASVKDLGQEASVFPNPASHAINLRDSEGKDIDLLSYRIIDASGRTALKSSVNDNTIDISTLSPGSYMIYMKDRNEVITSARFIKQ